MDDMQQSSNELWQTKAILMTTQWTYMSQDLPTSLNINAIPIEYSKSLRNLVIIFDNSFSLHKHIINICRIVYIELRWISSSHHVLWVDATKTHMCWFVLLKLDYCNFLLFGSQQYLIQLLQKAQDTAALLHSDTFVQWQVCSDAF